MFENFSRRNHLDRPEHELKYQYIPPAFRMDLYKVIETESDSKSQEYCIYRDSSVSINRSNVRLYTIEDIEERYNPDFFIEMLLVIEWHEVLSIIEFLLNNSLIDSDEINRLFDYHSVGYRVDYEGLFGNSYKIVVYYEELIEDNNKILKSDIPFDSVKQSIESAKKYLIDPNNIDIANSIKSSISAVEGYLKGYFQKVDDKTISTLGKCIKELKEREACPRNIIDSLHQLYIYRSSEHNVGHGSSSIGEFTVEDALLCNEMAISFINYFHRKFEI